MTERPLSFTNPRRPAKPYADAGILKLALRHRHRLSKQILAVTLPIRRLKRNARAEIFEGTEKDYENQTVNPAEKMIGIDGFPSK